jgi:hypothetical protein
VPPLADRDGRAADEFEVAAPGKSARGGDDGVAFAAVSDSGGSPERTAPMARARRPIRLPAAYRVVGLSLGGAAFALAYLLRHLDWAIGLFAFIGCALAAILVLMKGATKVAG